MLSHTKTEILSDQPFDVAVLVDVDKTLIVRRNDYNEELIMALKSTGYTKVYLFTSMTMQEIMEEIADPNYLSRPKLIKKLNDEGIEVVAVLTPADVTYNKGIGAVYGSLFLKQHRRIGQALTEKTFRGDKEFQEDSKKYKDYHDATARTAHEEKTPATEKTPLFKYFCTHRLATSYIVIDDVWDHLEAITRSIPDVTTLTCIKVNKESDQRYFETQLSSHCERLSANLERFLPSLIKSQKTNAKVFLSCFEKLMKRGALANREKNYDAACKYFEIAYFISDVAGISVENIKLITKEIAQAKENARSAGRTFFDNINVDTLYREVLNANPVGMQFRQIQLQIDLFKVKHAKTFQSAVLFFSPKNEERDDDLRLKIIHPIARVLSMRPDQLNMGLSLFAQVQPLIPNSTYQAGLATLRESTLPSERKYRSKEDAIYGELSHIIPPPLCQIIIGFSEEFETKFKGYDHLFKIFLMQGDHSNAFERFDTLTRDHQYHENLTVRLSICCSNQSRFVQYDNTPKMIRGAHLVVVCIDATQLEEELRSIDTNFLDRYSEISRVLLITNCNEVPSRKLREVEAKVEFIAQVKKVSTTVVLHVGSKALEEIAPCLLPILKNMCSASNAVQTGAVTTTSSSSSTMPRN
jgi:hypothetical protein